MAQITDFMQHKLQTGRALCVDDMLGAFEVIGVLQALTDITQEINTVMGVWADDYFFPDRETRKKKFEDAVKMIGNDDLYNIHALICLQADNMKSIAYTLEPYIEEPNAKKRQELYNQRQEMAKEYIEKTEPIMKKYLYIVAALYREQEEKLTAEIERREKETDSNEGRPQE